MSELIELSDSEIDEVGGGQPNLNINTNVIIAIANNILVAPSTAIAIGVLNSNSNVTALNGLLAGQGISFSFG